MMSYEPLLCSNENHENTFSRTLDEMLFRIKYIYPIGDVGNIKE